MQTNSKFTSAPAISASAHIADNIIGQPQLTISVKNTGTKDIAAMRFYAIPYDVYGEELKGVLSQNKLSVDTTVAAGESDSFSWQFLDRHVKTVKLYVYSIYYTDGTEWGDKEATKTTILNNAYTITVGAED